VNDMQWMFEKANKFNQYLDNWKLGNRTPVLMPVGIELLEQISGCKVTKL